MSKVGSVQSALFIGTSGNDDDAAVLVVGGYGGNGKEAELLTNHPHQRRGEQGSGGSAWSWQQLSPMQEKRNERPGILLLGRERVLVVGGASDCKTAEVLQLPRDDTDKGVWTLLTQQMTKSFLTTPQMTHTFYSNYLVNFNNRIVLVGELLIKLVPIASKHCLINMCCLHFRRE